MLHPRRNEEQQPWSVPRLWSGEVAFIVCGGPSVTHEQLERLRGRRVIVVNSSYMAAPWADYLLFTDIRWWRLHHRHTIEMFRGEIVTITPTWGTGFHHVLQRQRNEGLSLDPGVLNCWHTSVTTAINLAVLLGVKAGALLGLDGKDALDGRPWHHAPHPVAWGRNARRYKWHGEALNTLVKPLDRLGITFYNLNSDSAHRMFPFKTLDEMLC